MSYFYVFQYDLDSPPRKRISYFYLDHIIFGYINNSIISLGDRYDECLVPIILTMPPLKKPLQKLSSH